MPLYEYACRSCGTRFERMRKVSERLDGPGCPECGQATALAMSAPARVGAGGRPAGPSSIPSGGGCGPGCCGGSCSPSLN